MLRDCPQAQGSRLLPQPLLLYCFSSLKSVVLHLPWVSLRGIWSVSSLYLRKSATSFRPGVFLNMSGYFYWCVLVQNSLLGRGWRKSLSFCSTPQQQAGHFIDSLARTFPCHSLIVSAVYSHDDKFIKLWLCTKVQTLLLLLMSASFFLTWELYFKTLVSPWIFESQIWNSKLSNDFFFQSSSCLLFQETMCLLPRPTLSGKRTMESTDKLLRKENITGNISK